MPASEHILKLNSGQAPARTASIENLTDEELMSSFCAYLDEARFEVLLRRYGDPAWHVAAALLGTGTVAEDAVQEAFLHVIRSKATYHRGASFRNWFYAILRNVCCDELRRPAEAQMPDDEANSHAIECDPAATIVFREQAAAAWQAMGELPAHEREVLALRFYGGLDFSEIADCCGISSTAARQRASRGLDELRRRLARNPVTSSGDVRRPSVEQAIRREA